jgi:protein-tyrosine phosphatase
MRYQEGMTPHAATRDIALQGAANYRDLGGLRSADGRTVRPGRVLRGDSPHRLTPDDVAVLAAIGVRTVLDMRSEAEVDLLPATPLPAGGEIVHTPWRPPASIPEILGGIAEKRFLPLADLYEWFVDANLDYLATMFRVFAAPERHAVLFHCYAGKDRTGIVAAILLDVLGVPAPDIVADYTATDDHRKRFAELTDSDATELDFHLHDRAKVNPDLIFSPPKQMVDFLAIVARRWGSGEGLVRAAGLDDEQISSLRDNLLV